MWRSVPRPGPDILKMAVVVALLALVPFVFDDYWVHVTTNAGIMAILAMGLNLVFGVAGQITLAHGAFYATGAYASGLLTRNLGWPFELAMLAGLAISGLAAFIVARPTVRLRGLYLAMATLALQFAMSTFLVQAKQITNGPVGIIGIRRPVILGQPVTGELGYYYLVLFFAVVVYFLLHNIVTSRTGRAFRAIREDEGAARSLGIDAPSYKVAAFVVGAMCASLGGSLYAHFNLFISPDSFDVGVSILVLVMIVVGGLGSNVGAVIGAAVVAMLPQYLIKLLPEGITNIGLYQKLIFGSAMLLILLFAPRGLVGILSLIPNPVRAIRRRRSGGNDAGPQLASFESLTK